MSHAPHGNVIIFGRLSRIWFHWAESVGGMLGLSRAMRPQMEGVSVCGWRTSTFSRFGVGGGGGSWNENSLSQCRIGGVRGVGKYASHLHASPVLGAACLGLGKSRHEHVPLNPTLGSSSPPFPFPCHHHLCFGSTTTPIILHPIVFADFQALLLFGYPKLQYGPPPSSVSYLQRSRLSSHMGTNPPHITLHSFTAYWQDESLDENIHGSCGVPATSRPLSSMGNELPVDSARVRFFAQWCRNLTLSLPVHVSQICFPASPGELPAHVPRGRTLVAPFCGPVLGTYVQFVKDTCPP